MFAHAIRVLALAAPLTTTFLGLATFNANAVSATSLHTPHVNRRSNHARLASAQVERSADSKRSHGKKLRRRGDTKACKVRSTGETTTVENAASSGVAWAWTGSSSTQAADAASITAGSFAAASASESTAPQSAQASSSSSSAAAVVTSTPSSGGGTSGKPFGLAWPNGDWDGEGTPGYVGQYVGPTTGWYYNWGPQPCSKADALGLKFAPMIWGPKDCNEQFWTSQKSWSSNVETVLFFNEPNEISQSNVSPQDAVQYWKDYMIPLQKQGYKVCHAAVTNAPSGIEWIKKFNELCPECKYDCIPIHWYATSTENFKEYLQSFKDAFNVPLWVTEYACQSFNADPQCSKDQTWNLHQEMAKFFDEQDCPFGVMREMQGVNEYNRLMDASGSITPLGTWYKDSA
ncbi:hypothetical protein QFC19_003058 [Naganishia cerealis]|uniref:Uncharacterized protein n=1 Tax=Naganishia cerealis TaxID=610337 RepID=A0ACC2W5Q6_9TREE|nr:hypothetical protein QFC19_003058 [Naganishia cerealis]